MLRLTPIALIGSIAISGCSTAPMSVGPDTYFASATNKAGAFGSPNRVAAGLMSDGKEFCTEQGKEFQLVTHDVQSAQLAAGLGGASITFKCVAR